MVMSEMCRICLSNGQFISIFDKTDSVQLSAKIMSFTTVKITKGDKLPSVVCYSCANRVNELYEFKKKCEESDVKLRTRLSEVSIKTKDVVIKKEEFCIGDIVPENIKFETNYGSTDDISNILCVSNVTFCRTLGIKPDDVKHESILLKHSSKRKKKIRSEIRNSVDSTDLDTSYNDSHVDVANTYACSENELVEKQTKIKQCVSAKKNTIHKKRKCSKPQKEQCFTCGKVMSSRFRLKMHMRTHTGERPYECGYCPKKFALSQNLKVHERVHTGIKPLICTTCGRAFAQSAGLVAHMRLHTGETPYQCVLCPLAFRTPGHLQYHISRQHTGEKKHICNVCARAFITRGDLTQHSRTHSGERPHVCSTCGLRLARASHLARHMLTHTGAKPHACEMCSATYAQRGDLARHMRRHSHCTNQPETQLDLQKTITVQTSTIQS